MTNWLEVLAHCAAIGTAAVAAVGYGRYVLGQRRRRKALEAYLRSERDRGKDEGMRRLLHLMAKVGMTESELIQASFASRVIERRVSPNKDNNRAEALLLVYTG